jgi:hypothetical protein
VQRGAEDAAPVAVIASVAFAPSLTWLPSASLTSRRESAPVLTRSPATSAMPGASGVRTPSCSTQAGICTPSTTAAGAAVAGAAARAKPAPNKTA